MKNEDIMQLWLDDKCMPKPADDLAGDIMRNIRARGHHRSKFSLLSERLAEFISTRPLMRVAAVAAGAGGGAVRVGFMIYALLF